MGLPAMPMTTDQLRELLGEVLDTREIVIRPHHRAADGLTAAWRAAHDEATRALEGWRADRGAESFAVFRAAEDRADAAQDALGAP
jgi:hypothetical protein